MEKLLKSGRIPTIGENEKCYVIENGEKLALVRMSHFANNPATPEQAKQLAVDAGEIAKKDAKNWIAREIDDDELEKCSTRLSERMRLKNTK